MPSNTPDDGASFFDRDQAREEFDSLLAHNGIDVDDPNWEAGVDDLVDRLAACVRPATIDRDALVGILGEVAEGFGIPYPTGEVADRILALVRPVAGVTLITLTPEEAARALLWWAVYREEGFPGVTDAALVARLEAAQ